MSPQPQTAFSGQGNRLDSAQPSSPKQKKKKASKRKSVDSDEEYDEHDEYDEETEHKKISKTKALEMYEDIGLEWYHLESIPCQKAENPYGGKWPMKLYDTDVLAEVNEYESPKKKKSKTRRYDDFDDGCANFDADYEEFAPRPPTPHTPTKGNKPEVIARTYAKDSFKLTDRHLESLSYTEKPMGYSAGAGTMKLYNLADVHGLAITIHGQERFLNELLPKATVKREQRRKTARWRMT